MLAAGPEIFAEPGTASHLEQVESATGAISGSVPGQLF